MSEDRYLKLWEGLGYYNRVRNLHAAAEQIMEQYGGTIPDTVEELLRLKGIGSYTAGAIASIAYNRPVPAVDGNVLRVISRVCADDSDIMKQLHSQCDGAQPAGDDGNGSNEWSDSAQI